MVLVWQPSRLQRPTGVSESYVGRAQWESLRDDWHEPNLEPHFLRTVACGRQASALGAFSGCQSPAAAAGMRSPRHMDRPAV